MSKKYIFFLSALFVLGACGEDRTHEYDEKTECDHVIQKLVQENYLWGDSIKDVNWNKYFSTPSDFLKLMTTQAPVTDNWSYSSIDTTKVDYDEVGLFNHLDSYGIDAVLMTDPTSETTNQFARVVTVYPNSPASDAGIERGCFISALNGTKVSSKNISSLKKGLGRTLTIMHLAEDLSLGRYTWKDTITVDIAPSRLVNVNNVWMSKMITDDCAYVMFTNLNDDSAARAFMPLLGLYHPKNIIVDLRLCNIGTIDGAYSVGTFLSMKKGLFLQTIFRDNQCVKNCLYNVNANANMTNVSVYFITSNYTKGAAEWLIHGLKCLNGLNQVKVFGQKTAGQNLYLESFPISSYSLTLHLATAYVADGKGLYDYSSGIVPNIEIDEFTSVNLEQYGSNDEIILKSILASI